MRVIFIFCLAVFGIGFSLHSQNVTVNFSTTTHSVPTFFYSLNIWDGTNPLVNNDAIYKQRIDSLKLQIVRYHSAETYVNNSPKSWINYTTSAWNGTAVTTALQALQGKVQNRIIDIVNFPPWLNNNIKYIPVSMAPQFGKWCADLVRIVNKQSPYYTKYWEVFNELEANYVGQTAALATIYNTAVDSMKAVDSTIRIGAFSISHSYWSPNDQKTFYQNTSSKLDFVTYHHYGSASSNIPNQTIYNNAKSLSVFGANNIRSLMNQAGLPANKPLWLGETNVVWVWTGDTMMKKQRTKVGAIFDALLCTHALLNQTAKLSSMQLFNERDGVYGKLSATNAKRPSYHLLKYLSNNCYGAIKQFTTTLSDTVLVGHAVSNTSGNYIQLINRSVNTLTVSLQLNGLANSTYSVERTTINDSLVLSSFTFTGSAITQTVASETIVFLKLNPVTTTGVLEVKQVENSSLFPNPTTGKFKVITSEEMKYIRVISSSGILVKEMNVNDYQADVNLTTLPTGIYNTLIIFKNGKTKSEQLILR